VATPKYLQENSKKNVGGFLGITTALGKVAEA
jgi:hypothetical protein